MYLNHDLTDTIVALATPPGSGAIGVIRLSGKEAVPIVDRVFRGKKLGEQPSHTVHYGHICDAGGHVLDEVLVALFIAPRSYTAEDTVEVSCHGSSYIQQQLIQLFVREGARLARPGEFTLRAFLNGRIDLSQAEAVADLIASTTASSHDLAMKQMRGGFSNEIKQLREQLLNFASLLELELDFSEEDVEFADRQELKKLILKIQHLLKALIDSFHLGNVIKNGVSTVIAGRPNAGKSTLLNALLKEERAIVSDIPGTTRDTIEEGLNIEGILFRLIDTAGIRDAQDQIEAVGVQKTMEKIQQSAILMYVFDMDALSPAEVKADVEKLEKRNIPLLLIANKVDKSPKNKDFYSGLGNHQILFVSASKQENIEGVRKTLYEMVLSGNLQSESAIVSNARHFEALTRARQSLDDALHGMESGITSEFVAMDIRRALAYLGEITGEISTDDLLGNIFSKFCIGK